MRRYSDQEIINHLKERNGNAVKYVMHKYLPMVKYMVLNYKFSDGNMLIVGDEEDAEDIFQEALYIIINKIDKGEFILTAKFSTFLYAISKNLLKLKLKKRLTVEKYKSDNIITVEPIDEPTEIYEKNQKQILFDYYFLKLSPVCKKILKMSWEEKSNTDIATSLGNTVKYITKRKHECKKRFIELITTNPDNI